MFKSIQDEVLASIQTKEKILNSQIIINQIQTVSDKLIESYKSNGKLLIAGNGGSAADAQHIAGELVSRFYFDRKGLPAIALTTDTSILTAIGNDYGYEKLFARQIQAHAQPQDIFIGISTSGNSENIIQAILEAKKIGVFTVGCLIAPTKNPLFCIFSFFKSISFLHSFIQIKLSIPNNFCLFCISCL